MTRLAGLVVDALSARDCRGTVSERVARRVGLRKQHVHGDHHERQKPESLHALRLILRISECGFADSHSLPSAIRNPQSAMTTSTALKPLRKNLLHFARTRL